MRFDCYTRRLARRKKRDEKLDEKRRTQRLWHPYFAWYPIRVADTECRWMEWVERRGTRWALTHYYEWEYRAIK